METRSLKSFDELARAMCAVVHGCYKMWRLIVARRVYVRVCLCKVRQVWHRETVILFTRVESRCWVKKRVKYSSERKIVWQKWQWVLGKKLFYKTYFSVLLHFGIFHRVRVGQKRLKQVEHSLLVVIFKFFELFDFSNGSGIIGILYRETTRTYRQKGHVST